MTKEVHYLAMGVVRLSTPSSDHVLEPNQNLSHEVLRDRKIRLRYEMGVDISHFHYMNVILYYIVLCWL